MTDEMQRPNVQTEADKHLFPDRDEPAETAREMEALGKIKGKTLEVYYYLVDNPGEQGVREIQRALRYNSASVAAYHLNRLYDFDLVGKTDSGKYYIEGDPVKLGALEDHIRVAGVLIPRIMIYGVQALVSILAAVLLFVTGAPAVLWLGYVIVMNVLVLIKVVSDSKSISSKLQVSKSKKQE